MVLLHKITRNIIDSHPFTLMTLFWNETILRPSYISCIKKVKKDENDFFRFTISFKTRDKLRDNSMVQPAKLIS